jgi:protein-disulfide isomerase
MRWKPILLIFVLTVLGAGTIAVFAMTALDRKVPQAADDDTVVAGSQSVPLVTFIDPSRGAPDAAAGKTVVEYGDFSCPYCRAVEKDVTRLLAAHPEVRFVWKTVPNLQYPGSENLAEAGQCAHEQGRFWEFRDTVFNDGGGTTTETGLALMAKGLGLDVDAFSSCMTQDAALPIIERNVAEAQALGVDTLPYFFIGTRRLSGQVSYEQLEEALR